MKLKDLVNKLKLDDPNFLLGSALIGAGTGQLIYSIMNSRYDYIPGGALSLGLGLLTRIPEKNYRKNQQQ